MIESLVALFESNLFTVISGVMELITVFGIVFLVWDKYRATRLKAFFEGEQLEVETDDVKSNFQRNVLAIVSKKVGKGTTIDYFWKGNVINTFKTKK